MNKLIFRRIKNFVKPLVKTPLHPQWFTCPSKQLIQLLEGIQSQEKTLDIGCYDKWAKMHIVSDSEYIGLDYWETATQWYFSSPDVYGDAHTLPLVASTFDNVLLLDVLEHVDNIDTVLLEAFRVLKPNGKVIAQIPFLYPLHDTPRDMIRLTRFGLEKKAKAAGFQLSTLVSIGHPLETAALLKNIAVSKALIKFAEANKLFFLLFPILPFYFLWQNVSSFIVAKISAPDDFMPFSYIFVLEKVGETTVQPRDINDDQD